MARHWIPLVLLFLATGTAFADESPCGDYVRWLGSLLEANGVLDVTKAGPNLVVAAREQGLVLVDPNSANPGILGSEPATPASHVVVVGNLAFVTNSVPGSFSIVDISDPSSPSQLAVRSTLYHAYGVEVLGNYAYVEISGPGGPVGIEQFDVSNPSLPQSLGLWDNEYSTSISCAGDALYIGRNHDGLEIYDAGDPGAPTLQGSIAGFSARSILVDGDIAYVGNWDEAEILTIDISDPTQPALVQATPIAGNDPTGLVRYGSYLLVASGGFEVFDLSDPLAPAWMLSARSPNTARQLVTVGNVAYVADLYAGLQLFDLAPLLVPSVVATLPLQAPNADNKDIHLSGDYAYVLEFRTGLRIVDVSNPLAPAPGALAPTSDWNYALTVDGDRAYVSNLRNGVAIVDLSDPSMPDILGTVDTPAEPHGIAANGDHIYVADDWAGLHIVDVADPAAGSIVATQALSDNAVDVAYADGHAFVTTGAGLEIVDVGNPAAPSPKGSYAPAERGFGSILLDGNIAYCSGFRRFYILDVSDPLAPTLLADFSTAKYNAYEASLHEGHLLLGTQWGMMVVDVRDPADPQIVTQGIGGRDVYATASKNGHALLASGRDGLQIVPMDCQVAVAAPPQTMLRDRLVQVSPNPFNPNTKVEFIVAEDGPVRVSVYDLRGTLVRVLMDAPIGAGPHQVRWDGRSDAGHAVASGSYLIRLQSARGVRSAKALLLK